MENTNKTIITAMQPQISIIIPVYNGEKSIRLLVEKLVSQVSGKYNIEIVLINDGSPDNSEKECISIYHQFSPLVRFYSLSKNVGEHNAVMAGLNMCKGDYALIMDDDFQNPISEVLKLIQAAMDHPHDVVYTYYETKKHSWFRNIGSRFNDKIANYMLNKPKDLYLSSFKIINRFLINEITKYSLPFPYIDGLILRTTTYIGQIQVLHNQRESGKSGYTLKKLISLWSNMFVNFSILPLRIAMIVGFVFSGFGLLLGIQTMIERFLYPEIPIGYAAILVSVALFSGVQLTAIGMIGEYVGRMFLSQNKKPQFTIRRSFD